VRKAVLAALPPGPGSAALAALLERTRDVSDEVRGTPRSRGASRRSSGAWGAPLRAPGPVVFHAWP